MTDALAVLADLARELSTLRRPSEALEVVVRRAAEVLGTPRVSLRVLDASGTRLLTTCRAGQPLHWAGDERFDRGEGLVGWVAEAREPLRSGDAEADPRFVARPGMKEPLGSFIGVPLVIGENVIGVLSSADVKQNYFDDRHEQLLTVMAAVCAPYVEMARLHRLARVDPLTGALNRRALESQLPPAGTLQRPLCVVAVDIDHFKSVNDRHGHAAGDDVLKSLAAILAECVRAGDAVVRLGGEEFLLLLRDVGLAQALRVAERARTKVEGAVLATAAATLSVTASFGVAECAPDEDRDALFARADRALYAAKQGGRNRVEAAP